MKSLPFKDLRIIDLSTVLAGPSVGSFFAELGADVLKIEHPKHKDITRHWKLPNENPNSSNSAYFSSVNYKKNYKNLDLKIKEHREELLHLVQDAAIVLMNFKRGDQEKLGISDAILRKNNPQLIIGKINGFGTESDRVAYDLILQAESGIMSMNGNTNTGPIKMPIAFIDVLAAHHLKEAILIELWKKKGNQAYKGQSLNVSLYKAAIASLANQASNYLMANHIPQAIGSLHPNIAPYGELFQTKDNVLVTFAIGTNTHFQKLCDFLNLETIKEDADFNTPSARVKNRKQLYAILSKEIKKHHSEKLLNTMHKNYIPIAKIKNVKEVFEDPIAQSMIREEEIDGEKTLRVSQIAFD